MIASKSIALQGFLLTPIAMAVQGLLSGIVVPPEPPTTAGGKPARPRGAWIPYHPMPRRRPKSRRDSDIIFL